MRRVFESLKIMLSALCIGALAGCGADSPALPDSFPQEGEPVTLSFDLLGATVTRATGDEAMAEGKMFRIYAYPAGTTNFATPTGSESYTVQSDNTATGNLKLYRGAYDMYLVSYNSASEVPLLAGADSKIHVANGRDFMYTKLENIVVQPDQTGQSLMKVTLPRPFTRMGAQVVTTVAAKGTQPVTPLSLVVNYVKINGLYGEMQYQLNSTAWEAMAVGAMADQSYAFDGSGFSNNNNQTEPKTARESSPVVLLPVDGSKQKLEFEVNLTVSYHGSEGTTTMTDTYKASIEKSLLPGMTYQFDFSLTFYGVIIPTDLTLGIREWTTTDLVGEGLGKD